MTTYKCKVCEKVFEETDIHQHIFEYHEREILDYVETTEYYIIDTFVDYDSMEES